MHFEIKFGDAASLIVAGQSSLEEAASAQVTGLRLHPKITKGSPSLQVASVTAVGDGGRTEEVALLFNPRTGRFAVRPVETATCEFDAPPEEPSTRC